MEVIFTQITMNTKLFTFLRRLGWAVDGNGSLMYVYIYMHIYIYCVSISCPISMAVRHCMLCVDTCSADQGCAAPTLTVQDVADVNYANGSILADSDVAG